MNKVQTALVNEAKYLIGSIVISFVNSEVEASILVNEITSSKIGSDIFNNPSFGSEIKIKRYEKALKKVKPKNENVTQTLAWLNKLDICREKRNDIVHSMWTMVPVEVNGELKFGKLQMPKNGKKKIRSVTIAKIKEIENYVLGVQLEGGVLLANIIP
jgi:hypothetical protein